MLSEIVNLTNQSAELLDRATKAAQNVRGLRGGDRVYTPLPASAEFSQGTAPGTNLVFNVPSDADFWAYRLHLFPYCKVIDPVCGTPDEIPYRAASFVGASYEPGPATSSDFNFAVDGTFALIYDGRELQNVDVPMAAAYSTDVDRFVPMRSTTGGTWGAASQVVGGYVFDVPQFIPRGKSLTCRITPTYLGIRTIEETITVDAAPQTIIRQHKYKIVGVLEGEKRVAAYR